MSKTLHNSWGNGLAKSNPIDLDSMVEIKLGRVVDLI